MRAWRLHETTLAFDNIAKPSPSDGEILIRVCAAGVTPTELQWYPTTHTKAGGARSGAVPGHEFSGVVAAVGAGATGVREGDDVFGMSDWFLDGATAEFCVTRPEWVTLKPGNISHAEAAAVPIGALTALQGLFDKANLRADETVLIHGGAGAVGVFAVQMAAKVGARVITTASARSRAFLLELGAAEVIDYRTEAFEQKVSSVDVVFDAVGGETLAKSWGVLSPTGRLVTIAADVEGTSDERAKKSFFIVEPKSDALADVALRIAGGELRVFVDAEVEFENADDAYAGNLPGQSGHGKVVVRVGRLRSNRSL